MIFISHRGNIDGPNLELENNPSYIEQALKLGYDVEVDVRYLENQFWLGHDKSQYPVDYKFLMNEKLWCHAKNIEALFEMKKYSIHYFWHETDNVTLTSKNYVWAYPRITALKGSIAVLPEISNGTVLGCKGICSDFIENYKKQIDFGTIRV